jgi:hypothetical protein
VSNPVAEALGEYFDSLYQDTQGYVYFPVKETGTGRLRKFFLEWPRQRAGVINHVLKWSAADNAEIFYSPAIFKKAGAENKDVLGSWVAWCDFDGNAPTAWPTQLAPKPSLEVQSSTALKRHVYWRLSEFCSDPKALEKVNRALAYALGADTSGWDANQFLRPPFSVNRKYAKPITAKVVSDHPENVYSLDAFSFIPAPEEAIRASLDLDSLPPISDVIALAHWDKDTLDLFNRSFEEMSGQEHDRSGALQRLAYSGAEQGWSDEQIMAVLLDADDRWQKYTRRSTRERILVDLINRARAKHGYVTLSNEGLVATLMNLGKGEEQPETDETVTYSIDDILSIPDIDNWVLRDLMIPESLGLITGRPGVGKTQLAFQMAADLACGRENFIDWQIEVKPRKVLFFSLEMNARQMGHILRPLRTRYPDPRLSKNLVIHAKGDPIPLEKEWGQAYFLSVLDAHKPEVVFIDSLSLATGGNVSDDMEMKRLFDFLKVARNHYGFSLVIVHHHRKKANDAASKKSADSQSDIYGSYYIAASANFALNLEQLGDDAKNKEITMSLLKLRDAAPVDPFKVVRSDKLHFSRNEVKFSDLGL